jgi:hypothetical protein
LIAARQNSTNNLKLAQYSSKFMEFHKTTQILCLFVISILGTAVAYADEASDSGTANHTDTMWLGPPTEFYPQYIADPRRAQFALVLTSYSNSEVPGTTKARSSIRFGGKLGLVRFHPVGNSEVGWQIDLEAGFFSQFSLVGGFDKFHPVGNSEVGWQIDLEAGFFSQFSLVGGFDNYAWDGVQGLMASYKPMPQLGFRFGVLHDSAHLGDEYMEETGRERINYTREEIVAGVSWQPNRQWRLYSEITSEYETRGVARGERFQIGAEYFSPTRMWHGRLIPYTAADFNFFSERDWASAITAQIGLMMPTRQGSSRYRVAFEFSHGRSPMGEFSFFDETYVGLGLYYDI